MQNENQNAGTVPDPTHGGPEAGTAAAPEAGGNPESLGNAGPDDIEQLRAENERLARLHEEHLREKSNNEEMRRRLAAYESGEQRPTTQAPVHDDVARAQQELREDYDAFQAMTRHADPAVRAIGRQNLRQMQQALTQHRLRPLGDLPWEQRQEAERLVESGEVANPQLARELIELRQRSKAPPTTTNTNGANVEAARARLNNAPSMATRGVSAAELNQRKLKPESYTQQYDALISQGRRAEALALKRRKDADGLDG